MANGGVLKVILLGDGGVGKSSLMTRYVNNVFDESTLHTIGVEFLNKDVNYENKSYTLQIWDTGGQERFRSLRTPFYRGSDICILVYDVTNQTTFDNLDHWHQEFLMHAQVREEFPFLLLGNKVDLPERVVTESSARSWCTARNISYLESSAKIGLNVSDAFLLVVKQMIKQNPEGLGHNDVESSVIQLHRESKKEKKCCKSR